MSLPIDFVPKKPFEEFKWKWACLQCTEGLNDPVVLLGVLFRMRKLELQGGATKYNSQAFADELVALSNDIKDRGIGVDLARRTGERNLIRNSGQYWRALGLIPKESHGGVIELTDFGRKVADRKISQTEFAALTVQTLTLPNAAIQSEEECRLWHEHGIEIKPLLLLLKILRELATENQGFLTKAELIDIVIPLSGTPEATVADYVSFIKANRVGRLDLSHWPDCCPSANDPRMAREFLLFLTNYGYLNRLDFPEERFAYNSLLDDEIVEIIRMADGEGFDSLVEKMKRSDVTSEIERKRVQVTNRRPNQARFRRAVLGEHPRCIITNVTMPEVLEAAHIVPFKYHGEDTIANGFCMRMDIHQLFDSGHLRIDVKGEVSLTDRARMDYGALIPPLIRIPDGINLDFVRWRWENYNGV
jgi:hypothetical protein